MPIVLRLVGLLVAILIVYYTSTVSSLLCICSCCNMDASDLHDLYAQSQELQAQWLRAWVFLRICVTVSTQKLKLRNRDKW